MCGFPLNFCVFSILYIYIYIYIHTHTPISRSSLLVKKLYRANDWRWSQRTTWSVVSISHLRPLPLLALPAQWRGFQCVKKSISSAPDFHIKWIHHPRIMIMHTSTLLPKQSTFYCCWIRLPTHPSVMSSCRSSDTAGAQPEQCKAKPFPFV